MTTTHTESRVNEIIEAAAGGKTREEIAEMYGHKDRQAVDQFMRRRDYVWSRLRQNYIPKGSDVEPTRVTSSKHLDVITQLSKPGADIKKVADMLKFSDHRHMARYMETKGFRWDDKIGNYVPRNKEVEETYTMDSSVITTGDGGPPMSFTPSVDWSRYIPTLQALCRNEEKLLHLLSGTQLESSEIPRYLIPGVKTSKTIQLVAQLDVLIRDFSRERNISQREIVEVALIQFFRKYGYEYRVEQLFD